MQNAGYGDSDPNARYGSRILVMATDSRIGVLVRDGFLFTRHRNVRCNNVIDTTELAPSSTTVSHGSTFQLA